LKSYGQSEHADTPRSKRGKNKRRKNKRSFGQSHRRVSLVSCVVDPNQANEGIPYLQPLEDRRRVGCCCGAKLSPNISLRTWPGSWSPISLATRDALSLTCSRSFVSVQRRRATCSFLLLESSETPHFVYVCSLSSVDSRFCICLASISLSRCSFFALHYSRARGL
ncbi:Os02g0645266, partial [Oryza sativa Japonica Group]